jgi:hypothetical protein
VSWELGVGSSLRGPIGLRVLRGAVALIVLLQTPSSQLQAQRYWRIEDRAVVGAMLRVFAIASSFERLYVVGDQQVIYRDVGRDRWEGPFRSAGPGVLEQSIGAIVDPLDRSLWIVTSHGWLHYDPVTDLWDQGATGGPVLAAGFDRTRPVDGLFLRLPGEWVVATRGGGAALPAVRVPRTNDLVRVTTLSDVARANPQVAVLASGAVLGPGLRPTRLTAAAETSDRSGWWLGTDGEGLLFLPFASVTPEPRPWGLPGEVVGAVVAVPGGAWVVNDRTASGDPAVTRISEALDRFQWFQGDRVFGFRFQTIRALRIVDSVLWLGTDQGAIALSRSGERIGTLTEQDGLADRRVLSIAARRRRLVFGTAAGVAELTDSGVVRVAPAFTDPALSLALAGDTTWVGTPNGLFAALPGAEDIRQAPGWDALQLLRTPVPALLWHGDTLVALTERGLLWRDPRTGGWTLGPDIVTQVGRPRALADGAEGVWIAGSRGVGFAKVGGPVERVLAVGDALPGEAWDLSTEQGWLWVATSRGVVRFRRGAVEP